MLVQRRFLRPPFVGRCSLSLTIGNAEGKTAIGQKDMSESWKQWQGRTVDEKFPLQTYLGGSDQSAVFLTVVQEGAGQTAGGDRKAAIKLISVDAANANAEAQNSRWQEIRGLNHPALIRIFDSGTCEFDGVRLLYIVMEYAEENLSQVLPERALTAEETRATLPSVLDALQFVHGKGFVHGHIKPRNILAIGNQVKLSSDTLSRTGEGIDESRGGAVASISDPPEVATIGLSTASDVWQLGMTLIEVLTQRLPVWDRNGRTAPAIPQSIPEPFREIARNCLQPDAGKRWTIGQIREKLEGEDKSAGSLGASTSQRISAAAVAPQQDTSTRDSSKGNRGSQKESAKWPVWVAIAAVVVIAFVLIARPKRSSSDQPATETKQGTAQDHSRLSLGATGAASTKANPAHTDGDTNDAQSGVVQRVMPQVSPSARRTIQGKIKVRVRVGVDAAGNVSSATFESAGPSKYFSRIAMEAARQWKFSPSNGGQTPREWRLQFTYTRTKTEASAAPVTR
jgi:TonB family protein